MSIHYYGKIVNTMHQLIFEQALSNFIEVPKNVMKMKFWPFKAGAWFLIERGKMYNKSIQEQAQSGMIKLE